MKIDTIRECNIKLSSAPASLVYKGTPDTGVSKGTILFYHGLKACKETNIKELRSLAEHGFLAVGIDSVGHGERAFPDLDHRLSAYGSGDDGYLDMVRKTSEEIPEIVDALIGKGLADPNKIGITGISMGGYVTYGAVLADKRIKVAAPVLGSPIWAEIGDGSPHHHPDKFFPVALLAQNAGKDESVSPHFAREFHEKLQPFYSESPEKLCYYEFPESGHFMLEDDWNNLWKNLIDWFERFLV